MTTEPQALRLESCPACGRDVSPQAMSCPQCGHPGPGARVTQKAVARRHVVLGRFLLGAGALPAAVVFRNTGLWPLVGVLPLAVLGISWHRPRVAVVGGRVVIGLVALIVVASVLDSGP